LPTGVRSLARPIRSLTSARPVAILNLQSCAERGQWAAMVALPPMVGGSKRRGRLLRRSENIECRVLRTPSNENGIPWIHSRSHCRNTFALGHTWPTKPMRAIVPFTAGSASDIVPHAVFEELSGELRQSIMVENRSGAGGTIAVARGCRRRQVRARRVHNFLPTPPCTRSPQLQFGHHVSPTMSRPLCLVHLGLRCLDRRIDAERL